MKKNLLLLLFMTAVFTYGQVGVNTSSPNATLDVVGKPTITTSPDGVIAPRLTGDQLEAKDNVYGADQKGTLVYVTAAVTAASTKTANVTKNGYYMFDGTVWRYAFGTSTTDNISTGELAYYHGIWGSATNNGTGDELTGSSANGWLSYTLHDLPILDDKIRLDGYFALPVSGSSTVAFNPRLVNVSST